MLGVNELIQDRSHHSLVITLQLERVLGNDHPSTATILNNLGGVLQSQGQYLRHNIIVSRY